MSHSEARTSEVYTEGVERTELAALAMERLGRRRLAPIRSDLDHGLSDVAHNPAQTHENE
jgi:hypothetical protein